MTERYFAAYLYFVTLGLLTLTVAVRGTKQMMRTMLCIGLNCLAANVWTLSQGGGEPWGLFMVLDTASARIVLWQPAGRIQAIIGMIFIAKLAMSTGYAFNGSHADPVIFWWLLTVSGFLQLLLVGGWWASVQFAGVFSLRRLRKVALAARRQGLER